MKITVKPAHIKTQLNAAFSATASKSQIAAYTQLYLCADDTLKIVGTDGEVTHKTNVDELIIKEKGSVCVNARKLNDIIKKLTTDITIETKDDNVIVKSGRSRFKLATFDTKEYPEIELDSMAQDIKLNGKELANGIGKVSYAMASNDVRYYLNGLHFNFTGDCLDLVATDGHRLARTEIESDVNGISFILPAKSVKEIQKAVNFFDEVTLSISDRLVSIQYGNQEIINKLIDGKFPDYHRVIPTGNKNELKIDAESFKNSISRATILTNEKYRGVRLNISKTEIKISANNPEQETSEDFLGCDSQVELEVGFNSDYVFAALQSCDSETVSIMLGDSDVTPALINDGKSQFVLMPMRL